MSDKIREKINLEIGVFEIKKLERIIEKLKETKHSVFVKLHYWDNIKECSIDWENFEEDFPNYFEDC